MLPKRSTSTGRYWKMDPVTLYGMKVSGHTSRTRSYPIKAGIPFCERAPGTRHHLKTVVPLAGGVRVK